MNSKKWGDMYWPELYRPSFRKNIRAMSLQEILTLWQKRPGCSSNNFYDIFCKVYVSPLAWKCVHKDTLATAEIIADVSRAYQGGELGLWIIEDGFFLRKLRARIISVLDRENDLDRLWRLYWQDSASSRSWFFISFVIERIKIVFADKSKTAKEEAEKFKGKAYRYNQTFFGCQDLLDALGL